MKPNAIVYTSNTGFTEQYGRLLGENDGLVCIRTFWSRKGLAEKKDRTPEEDVMLELLIHGGSCVREENLADVLEWYGKEA